MRMAAAWSAVLEALAVLQSAADLDVESAAVLESAAVVEALAVLQSAADLDVEAAALLDVEAAVLE